MNRKQIVIIFGCILTLGILPACSRISGSKEVSNMPPLPPIGENIGPDGPRNSEELNEMRKRLDAACISGIMETGSNIFQELTRNGTDKVSKLKFIKEKLQSIYTNTKNSDSKRQIDNQIKAIDEMIEEMGKRDIEVKKDPNVICQKAEEMKQMNKHMREKIIGLSGDMKIIREHEKNEGVFQHIKEKIFGEDPKEDFEDTSIKQKE